MMWAGGFCLTLVRDVAPLSLSPSWEWSSLFPLHRVGETANRAQRNNCTKYSPAVTMATGLSASSTSTTLFCFTFDPEKAPGRLASSRSNFRVQVRSVRSWGGTKSNADTFLICSRRAFTSRTAELLLKLRNLRCCNASKSTLNY